MGSEVLVSSESMADPYALQWGKGFSPEGGRFILTVWVFYSKTSASLDSMVRGGQRAYLEHDASHPKIDI